MSTRCQIGFYRRPDQYIKKWDALLYRHCDGYPDSVVPDILPFLQEFQAKRGLDDSDYAAAWLMHYLIDRHIKSMMEWHKTFGGNVVPSDGRDWLGHGITNQLYLDIEYFYAVFPDRLAVYDVPNAKKVDTWKLLDTIQIPKGGK